MSCRKLASLVLATVSSVLIAAVGDARATTIVPVSDHDLAVSSRVVVEGRVLDARSAWSEGEGLAYTYVTVAVDRSIKGDLTGGSIVLKQLGGRVDGGDTIIFGAPELVAGQRVILFLNTDADGALRVAHLSLGNFRVETDAATGEELVVRPLDDVDLAKSPNGKATERAPYRDFVASVRRAIDESPSEVARYAANFAGEPVLRAPREFEPALFKGRNTTSFTFLGSGFRWFEPDSGARVSINVNPRNGPTASGGVDEAKAAFAAWTNVDRSSINIVYGGATSACGFKSDGASSISFGDCLRQIDDPVNCSGVVAIGGITRTMSESISIGGRSFLRIAEADVAVNNGFDCLTSNSAALAEVLTHEFGHGLGFGHSSENRSESNSALKDATMYFVTHNDGRGAAVRSDDVAAAQFLYPGNGGSGGAPVVERAAYKEAKSRLAITGRRFSAEARVTVNGRLLGVPVKFSAAKSRITLEGTRSALNLREGSTNTVVVTVDGEASETFSF